MEEVRLTEVSDPAGGLLTKNRVCIVCEKQVAKYTCPKCNGPYCSLPCYKRHGENCTETFYQQNLMESLKNERATEEEKKQMLQLLQRMHEEQEEGEEEEDVTDNLSKMNLNDESSLSFESLTKEQLADFKKALANGTLGDMIELWKPWWEYEENKRRAPLITVIGEDDTSTTKDKPKAPPILESIPPLNNFLKKEPSPLLAFNLVDIMYAYVYMQRLYNGEPQIDILESMEVVLAISSVLSKNAVYETISSAVSTVLENSLKPEVRNSNEFSLWALKDVCTILTSERFVMIALSDLHELLGLAISSTKNQKGGLKKALTLAQKKVLFFASWANEQPDTVFSIVHAEVERLWAERDSLWKEGKKAKE